MFATDRSKAVQYLHPRFMYHTVWYVHVCLLYVACVWTRVHVCVDSRVGVCVCMCVCVCDCADWVAVLFCMRCVLQVHRIYFC